MEENLCIELCQRNINLLQKTARNHLILVVPLLCTSVYTEIAACLFIVTPDCGGAESALLRDSLCAF